MTTHDCRQKVFGELLPSGLRVLRGRHCGRARQPVQKNEQRACAPLRRRVEPSYGYSLVPPFGGSTDPPTLRELELSQRRRARGLSTAGDRPRSICVAIYSASARP